MTTKQYANASWWPADSIAYNDGILILRERQNYSFKILISELTQKFMNITFAYKRSDVAEEKKKKNAKLL